VVKWSYLKPTLVLDNHCFRQNAFTVKEMQGTSIMCFYILTVFRFNLKL